MSSFALLKSISRIAHINCIDALWPGKRCLSHGLYIYQCDAAPFKYIDVKIGNNVIIASLKSEPKGTYQVRVSWYQDYQARLWEHILNRSAEPRDSTGVLKALPGKRDIKRLSPRIIYTLGRPEGRMHRPSRHLVIKHVEPLPFLHLWFSRNIILLSYKMLSGL